MYVLGVIEYCSFDQLMESNPTEDARAFLSIKISYIVYEKCLKDRTQVWNYQLYINIYKRDSLKNLKGIMWKTFLFGLKFYEIIWL
jgi:hypothetical protein